MSPSASTNWAVYSVKAPDKTDLETDPRFPSGPWIGYFLDPRMPGRHMMELFLTFRKGQLTGEGRDQFGAFILRGQYSLTDGKCHWTKRYIGKHDVFYQGFNEGKGIWGVWEIATTREHAGQRGGFHIWPKGMSDPTGSHLTEEADLPVPVKENAESEEHVAQPVCCAREVKDLRLLTRARDSGEGQRFLAMRAHPSVANLAGVVTQFALTARTAEVID